MTSYTIQKKIVIASGVLALAGIAAALFWFHLTPQQNEDAIISSFEECVAAGHTAIDTDPERCEAPDGREYVRVVPEAEQASVTSSITNRGELICLPAWDTTAPATDSDCVLGLKNVDQPGDTASHGPLYALRNIGDALTDVPIGSNIIVSGTLVRGSHSSTHQSVGYIEIQDITPVIVTDDFSPVTFACPADYQFTIWYSEAGADRAVLDVPVNERYALARTRSASGARYANADESVEFWEHQGEARITVGGEVVRERCVVSSNE